MPEPYGAPAVFTILQAMSLQIPQPNLKAKNLPPDLFPHEEKSWINLQGIMANLISIVMQVHMMSLIKKFYPLITANIRLKQQDIRQEITQLYRVKV